MEALEPVGNIDFVKKLSQMSGRSELAKQNMARGEKALCLVHTLKQDYELSQEQLALLAGLNRNTIGKLERGESSPSIDTIEKIASVFKMSFNELTDVSKVEL